MSVSEFILTVTGAVGLVVLLAELHRRG